MAGVAVYVSLADDRLECRHGERHDFTFHECDDLLPAAFYAVRSNRIVRRVDYTYLRVVSSQHY